jgi:hypothetical protein
MELTMGLISPKDVLFGIVMVIVTSPLAQRVLMLVGVVSVAYHHWILAAMALLPGLCGAVIARKAGI